MEDDAQSFSQFLTSGESAHIKAKLTQIRRYWEELRDHAQHLEEAITGKASALQKHEENFMKVDIKNAFLVIQVILLRACVTRANQKRCCLKYRAVFIQQLE